MYLLMIAYIPTKWVSSTSKNSYLYYLLKMSMIRGAHLLYMYKNTVKFENIDSILSKLQIKQSKYHPEHI